MTIFVVPTVSSIKISPYIILNLTHGGFLYNFKIMVMDLTLE